MIEEAKKRFQDHVTQKKIIPADLRGLIYSLVVSNGNKNDYEAVLNIYQTAEMHEEKLRALRALGSAVGKKKNEKIFIFFEKRKKKNFKIP